MLIADLLTADRIVMLSDPGHRDTVLDAAARLLSSGSPMHTMPIAESLRQREQISSTGIGHGIAIPHARSNIWQEARGAFLRLAYPVDFSANDGRPVDLIFAMIMPEHSNEHHLQLLAHLAEKFSDAHLRDAIRDAPDMAGFRAAVHRFSSS